MIKWTSLVAECIGTLILVLAVLLSRGQFVIVAATLGALILMGARFGGANFNPAVSLAMGLKGSLPWPTVAAYMGSQLAGGALAFAMAKYM